MDTKENEAIVDKKQDGNKSQFHISINLTLSKILAVFIAITSLLIFEKSADILSAWYLAGIMVGVKQVVNTIGGVRK